MNNYLYKDMIIYLFNEVGLEESSIELGIKLSIKKFLSEFNLSIAFEVLEVQIT